MKLSALMATKSVICLAFGVILGLAPGAVLAIFGVKNVDSSLIFMSRLSGAIFVLLGLLLWFAKDDPGSVAMRGILLAVSIGDAIAFLVTLIGQLGNVMNGLGWLVVGLYLLLSFGFGYFYLQVAKPGLRPN
jgi:hypothetical protein